MTKPPRCTHQDGRFRCEGAAGHDTEGSPEWDHGHVFAPEYYLGNWPPFEEMTEEWRSNVAGLLAIKLLTACRETDDMRRRHDAELHAMRIEIGRAGRAWDRVRKASQAGRKTIRITELMEEC